MFFSITMTILALCVSFKALGEFVAASIAFRKGERRFGVHILCGASLSAILALTLILATFLMARHVAVPTICGSIVATLAIHSLNKMFARRVYAGSGTRR